MKKIVILFCVFTLYGCQILLRHPTITYCYDGKNTGIDTLINIDGYYKFSFVYNKNDTAVSNIVLFADGIFLYNFDLEYYQESKDKVWGFYNRGGVEWGIYKLTNDTIFVQTVESPGGMSWLPSKMALRVIDSVTLEMLPLYNNSIDVWYIPLPLKFVAYKDLPDPNKSWIIKNRWFWCDKEAYKKWKKQKRKWN